MTGGKVYIGNLGADPLDESDLEEEFEEFGLITSIFVARNPPGFAYIDYDDERDAKGMTKQTRNPSNSYYR